jgi:hypothetical protein
MKKLISIATASAAVLLAAAQPASAREFADIYTECGLGAMIAPNNSAVAAVTNVTWDLGTTAISSNASSPESCQGGKGKKAAFLHDAYAQIETDLARGGGQHLSTLMTLSGCQASAQPALAVALRQDFAAARTGAVQTRFQQAEALYNLLEQRVQQDFAGSCTL